MPKSPSFQFSISSLMHVDHSTDFLRFFEMVSFILPSLLHHQRVCPLFFPPATIFIVFSLSWGVFLNAGTLNAHVWNSWASHDSPRTLNVSCNASSHCDSLETWSWVAGNAVKKTMFATTGCLSLIAPLMSSQIFPWTLGIGSDLCGFWFPKMARRQNHTAVS